jgi:hypothetical protein
MEILPSNPNKSQVFALQPSQSDQTAKKVVVVRKTKKTEQQPKTKPAPAKTEEQHNAERLRSKGKQSKKKENRKHGSKNGGWEQVSNTENTEKVSVSTTDPKTESDPEPKAEPEPSTYEDILKAGDKDREKQRGRRENKRLEEDQFGPEDHPELYREEDDRFVYTVRTWERGFWYSSVGHRSFWVYQVDVPYLESIMPKNNSSQALSEFCRTVRKHYHKELAALLVTDRAEWLERRNGLEQWPFHHLSQLSDTKQAVTLGCSKYYQRYRESNNAVDRHIKTQGKWRISWRKLRERYLPKLWWFLAFIALCALGYCLYDLVDSLGTIGATNVHPLRYHAANDTGRFVSGDHNAVAKWIPPPPPWWRRSWTHLQNPFFAFSILAAERLLVSILDVVDYVSDGHLSSLIARPLLRFYNAFGANPASFSLTIIAISTISMLLFWLMLKLFAFQERFVSNRRVYWRYFSLVYRCPILMAKIEEYAKRIWGVATLIGYIESCWHGSMVPYHFHTRTAEMSLGDALELHLNYNRSMLEEDGWMHDLYCELTRGEITSSEFINTLFENPEGRVNYRLTANKPSILQPIAPRRIHIGSSGHAAPIISTPLGSEPKVVERSGDFYGEMFCVLPWGRPGRTKANLLGAYNWRLADEWNRTTCAPEQQRNIRRHAEKVFSIIVDYLRPMSEEEWEDSLEPKHRLRLLNALNLDLVGNEHMPNTIFGKTDELLPIKQKADPEDNTMCDFFVQRPIINVSDQMWARTARATKRVQLAFGEMYPSDCPIRHIAGKGRSQMSYRGYYTCKASNVDLDRFWNEALTCELEVHHQMFQGDDSAIIHYIDGRRVGVAIDYTSYDSHQHAGHLNVFRDMLREADPEAAKEYKKMYTQPWEVRVGEYTSELFPTSPGWFSYNMRATGENGTSVGNSAANFNASLMVFRILKDAYFSERQWNGSEHAFKTVYTPERIAREFKRLGLVAKVQLYDMTTDWHYIDFLKGTWLKGKKGKARWVPLLSRIVKVGKFMQSPRLTDRRKMAGWHKAAQAIYGQWLSFGNLSAINTGLWRITEHFKTLAQGIAVFPEGPRDWEIKGVNYESIDLSEFSRFLRVRYEIDYDDWISCVRTITSIQSFPCDWCHPVAWRLFEVDYC